MTSTTDTIRMLFTYGIALIIIVGGLTLIYVTRLDPPESDVQGLRLLVAGLMGAATAFVFQQETQTRTARQTNTAQMAGGTMHANGISSTSTPPDIAE